MASVNRLKKPDKKREVKRLVIKTILEITKTKRLKWDIYDILVREYKVSLTRRNFEHYMGELVKRRLFLVEKDLYDLRKHYYQTNNEKIGRPGQQYLMGVVNKT